MRRPREAPQKLSLESPWPRAGPGLRSGPGSVIEEGVHLRTLQPEALLGVPEQHPQCVTWTAAGQRGTVRGVQLAARVTAEGGQGARSQAAVHLVAGGLGDGPVPKLGAGPP